jgi:uncharacterized delta-60 repeat protein
MLSGIARGQANFAGRLDASFHPPTDIGIPLFVHETYAVAIQSDGRVLFGGRMDYEGDELIRLNIDGSRDSTFNGGAPVGFTEISAIIVQPDGAILVAGAHLTRLLPDGTLDPSFSAELAGDSTIWKRPSTRLALQTDGKILVTGYFTSVNGIPSLGIARLLPDGSLDSTFAFNPNDIPATIDALQLHPTGKVLVAGYNYTAGYKYVAGTIIRLMSSGSLDTSFVTDPERGVSAIALHGDGRIVVAGYYWNGSYQQHGYINRLKENGSDDPGFFRWSIRNYRLGTEGVHALIVQPDGKILAGGSFFLEDNLGSLLRLNADGTIDTGFDSSFQSAGGDDIYSVTSMALQSDGRFLHRRGFRVCRGCATAGHRPHVQCWLQCTGSRVILRRELFHHGKRQQPHRHDSARRVGPRACHWSTTPSRYFPIIPYPGLQFRPTRRGLQFESGQVTFANGETSKTFSPAGPGTIRASNRRRPSKCAITGSSAPLAYGDRTKHVLHVFDDDSLGLPGSIDPAFDGGHDGNGFLRFRTQPTAGCSSPFFTFIRRVRSHESSPAESGWHAGSFIAPTCRMFTALVLQPTERSSSRGRRSHA